MVYKLGIIIPPLGCGRTTAPMKIGDFAVVDTNIVRRVLMDGRTATGWKMKALLVALAGPGCMILFTGFQPLGYVLATVLGGPLAFMSYFVFRMKFGISAEAKLAPKVAADARTALISYIGREPRYIDTDTMASADGKSLVGTGMAWDGEHLYVLDAGEVARIALPAIRSWNWNIEAAAQTKLYGKRNAGTDLAVAADNMREAANARKQSGFFITVADIDKPLWKFTTRAEAVLRRWAEILTQINEGRLSAAE
jgi:hypothetical protein